MVKPTYDYLEGEVFMHNHVIGDITGLKGALVPQGAISIPSNFPLLSEVTNGWWYEIKADVTDNDASKTNTGQSFKNGDEIYWNGTNWTISGNELGGATWGQITGSLSNQTDLQNELDGKVPYAFESLAMGTSTIQLVRSNVIGYRAGRYMDPTSFENTIIGYRAFSGAQEGNRNVIIGSYAADGYYNGCNYNTIIGDGAGGGGYNNIQKSICLGYRASVTGPNQLAIGTESNLLLQGNMLTKSFIVNNEADLFTMKTQPTGAVPLAVATTKYVDDNAPEVTYTGDAERTVGGITDGDTFTDATTTEMWDKLIKEEKFPVLTAPNSTFVSTITGLREIGDILTITFSSAFSRGSINPQYTATSPFRSGLPNEYQFTGPGLSNQTKTDLTDSQPITGYTVVTGAQSWQGRVAYDGGVQPKSSYDNNYSTPLAAGNTSYTTRTITGVYPYFATTATITVMTKQSLALMNSSYVQTDIIAESGSDKQKVDFPTGWSAITGIQFYNTVSSAWEWIGGSKANSLLTFTQSATTHTVQGNVITYTKYTHNGSTIGARQLRWYTT